MIMIHTCAHFHCVFRRMWNRGPDISASRGQRHLCLLHKYLQLRPRSGESQQLESSWVDVAFQGYQGGLSSVDICSRGLKMKFTSWAWLRNATWSFIYLRVFQIFRKLWVDRQIRGEKGFEALMMRSSHTTQQFCHDSVFYYLHGNHHLVNYDNTSTAERTTLSSGQITERRWRKWFPHWNSGQSTNCHLSWMNSHLLGNNILVC